MVQHSRISGIGGAANARIYKFFIYRMRSLYSKAEIKKYHREEQVRLIYPSIHHLK